MLRIKNVDMTLARQRGEPKRCVTVRPLFRKSFAENHQLQCCAVVPLAVFMFNFQLVRSGESSHLWPPNP
jgi:hypothetical protein